MKEAKISEIFLSYQGEGPFAGSRELFVRFYGCNLNCRYCDTRLESYKSFTKEALLGKILDFEDDYNEFTVTGGEPLLYADFLKEFLPLFRKHRDHRIYLETNGVLFDGLKKVLPHVDIIAMDFKLPSSSGMTTSLWAQHKKFFKLAVSKELIVKIIVTDNCTIDDVKEASCILSSTDKDFTVILQPVTPVGDDFTEPDGEMLSYFKGFLNKETGKKVSILGQMHKHIGVK